MTFSTCDLCDQFPDRVRVLAPIFRHYGGRTRFAGSIVTIKCFEDNVLIREAAVEEGRGRVMVIDGGGSLRSALVGDGIAEWARDHGWAGMIIYGCVRDTIALAKVELGVMAIGVNPVTPGKRRVGARDLAVTFGDVRFVPGEYVYCDEDGVVVAAERLDT
ncbi:MAG TPA: ribonuclease E activity regulator RraA [Burkholderiales bacterium]|nr:ribonuclease E activity regulator RraA [Burkholderiales bacterium]